MKTKLMFIILIKFAYLQNEYMDIAVMLLLLFLP